MHMVNNKKTRDLVSIKSLSKVEHSKLQPRLLSSGDRMGEGWCFEPGQLVGQRHIRNELSWWVCRFLF